MIFAWLKSLPKAAYLLAAVVFVIIVAASLSQCSGDRDKQTAEQAKQTTTSGEAIADAAQDAVAKIETNRVTNEDIDAAVAETQENLDHAEDPAAIRAAVIAGVCGNPAHRSDPACKMR
ncbi:hypothetical protein [Novosphingobium sp. ZW T3_23]|uniref:hypothetical protein n=1 Tax=Novosphingobium sp. ZW T3_23 TaxID=3378084 RepID=UPI00385362EE